MKKFVTFLIVLVICIASTACGGGGSKTPSSSATLEAVSVGASSNSLGAGKTLQLTAIATYSDNSTKDVTATSAWQSSDSTVATISNSGMVTTLKAGTFKATATMGTMSGSMTFTVTAQGVLASVAITPASTTVIAGQTKQLTATGTYSDLTTKDITSTVTWSSSSQSVATVNASGLLTAVTAGTTTVTASSGAVSKTASITVTAPPAPTLASILITPGSTILAAGQSKQLKATGTYGDGSAQDLTSTVTWTSTSQSATVNASTGLVTAESLGSATITAVFGSVSATATVTVTAAILTSVEVSPVNAIVFDPSSGAASVARGQTQQFAASGIFSDGSQIDITNSVTWNTDAPLLATMSLSVPGLASGISAGTANVIATSGAVVGSAPLVVTPEVLQSIDISPDDQSIPIAGQVQYTVTGTFSDTSTQDLTNATYTSSDTNIATIDPVTGVATGVAPGLANITATVGSLTTDTATLTVLSPTLKSIVITAPIPVTLAIGTTTQLGLTGIFSDGSMETLTQNVSWTSYPSAIAGIDANGLTTALAVGQATITASYGGLSAPPVNLTVVLGPPVSVSVTPALPIVGSGGTKQFTAIAVFIDGSWQDVTSQAQTQWMSSAANVATISADGLATAVSLGTAQITATYQGITGSTTLTVSTIKLTSINVTPSSPSVPTRSQIQFTAIGVYSDGSMAPLTGVRWHASSASMAKMGGSGLLKTKNKANKTMTVSATLNGITGTTTVKVVLPSALSSVTITPNDQTIAPGTTQQFVLTGTFGDGTTLDLSKSAYWQTSNYQDAVISNSGLATAVGTGEVTITATFKALPPDQTELIVSNASILSVSVTPLTPTVPLGSAQQFKATGTFSDQSTQDITSVSQWTSSNLTTAVVNKTGLATSAGRGTSNIGATFKTTTATATGTTVLTVN